MSLPLGSSSTVPEKNNQYNTESYSANRPYDAICVKLDPLSSKVFQGLTSQPRIRKRFGGCLSCVWPKSRGHGGLWLQSVITFVFADDAHLDNLCKSTRNICSNHRPKFLGCKEATSYYKLFQLNWVSAINRLYTTCVLICSALFQF